jgi:hypothetical protein
MRNAESKVRNEEGRSAMAGSGIRRKVRHRKIRARKEYGNRSHKESKV